MKSWGGRMERERKGGGVGEERWGDEGEEGGQLICQYGISLSPWLGLVIIPEFGSSWFGVGG